MRAQEFILITEGYREAEQAFAQSAAPEQVKKAIEAYKSLVDRNQVQGPERNIDYWRKQGWDQFSNFVQDKSQQRSQTQIKRSRGITAQQITLRDDAQWLIVIPLDKDTSCFHGRGTDWCTTKSNQKNFEEYFYDNHVVLVYCINKQGGGKWAIAIDPESDPDERAEFFDHKDNSLSQSEFNRWTGLNSQEIIKQALSQQNMAIISKSQEAGFMSLILTNPQRACDYATATGRRWPEAEPIIAQDAIAACQYATEVIGGRWPEVEPAIAQLPMFAKEYAKWAIRGRWPKAEPAILQNPRAAYLYARDVIGGRWPEAEPAIARDPKAAEWYAQEVIKGPWPEAGIK